MTHERDPNNPDNATPKDEQRTPPSLFRRLDNRFHFALDASATPENSLCQFCWTKETNALLQEWHKLPGMNTNPKVYCNPPYSRGKILPFVKKGYYESLKGATVVMLLPADISTGWWDWCMFASEWIRVKGRVKFHNVDGTPSKGSPKFGIIVVVFDAKQKRKNDGQLIVSEMGWD